LEVLYSQHLFLGSSRTASLLASDLLFPHLFRTEDSHLKPFDPVKKQASRQEAVQRLRALALALDGEARRQVDQVYAGGGLVYLLTAGTGRADKRFAEIALSNAKLFHPVPKCPLFF
jgi:hypothetical protein